MFDEHTAIGLDRRSLSEVDWIWPPGLPGRLDQKPHSWVDIYCTWQTCRRAVGGVDASMKSFHGCCESVCLSVCYICPSVSWRSRGLDELRGGADQPRSACYYRRRREADLAALGGQATRLRSTARPTPVDRAHSPRCCRRSPGAACRRAASPIDSSVALPTNPFNIECVRHGQLNIMHARLTS